MRKLPSQSSRPSGLSYFFGTNRSAKSSALDSQSTTNPYLTGGSDVGHGGHFGHQAQPLPQRRPGPLDAIAEKEKKLSRAEKRR